MKQIYFLICLLSFSICLAQDTQLFENTWYLRTVQRDDLAVLYNVAEINPPIAPYLLISEDFNFNGEGACNAFNGTYSFFSPNSLTATDFTAATNDCGIQIQNLFEDAYFGFVSGDIWYNIIDDGGNLVLTFGNPLGGTAVFKNYALSTKDFYRNKFTIYPNPAKNELILSSKNTIANLTIKIFNIEGKLLSTQNLEFEKLVSVDVSSLSRGIYFLDIEDGNGNSTIKKFIKN